MAHLASLALSLSSASSICLIWFIEIDVRCFLTWATLCFYLSWSSLSVRMTEFCMRILSLKSDWFNVFVLCLSFSFMLSYYLVTVAD